MFELLLLPVRVLGEVLRRHATPAATGLNAPLSLGSWAGSRGAGALV
ncbi:hypothetical protein ACFVFQ_10685 [Streptomyces sp. NPDC057743]